MSAAAASAPAPPAATKTKSRNGNQGRRTGVTVPKNGVIRSAEDMMEDAEALFETAVSPASAESSKENDAAAKEKKELRFSLAESVADELLVDDSNDTSLSSQHPVRQLVRHSGRASIDTNDLSSVSTAAASVKEPEVQPEEEEEKQPAVEAAEEDEVELARHNESMKHTPDSPGDFPIDNDDNADDPIDDELVPPPPPPPGSDTETEDEDDDNEEGNDNDNPEALKTQLEEDEHENEKASFLDTSQPNEEDDFPTADGDEDDDGDDGDGDKEGTGFEMGGTVDDDDDNEVEEQDEDPETPESVLEKRRRKAERAEKLAAAAKKKKKKAATASASNKKKKTKKKAAAAESSDDEDNDDESTPVPKKKKPAAKKKKFNRFATTFSPKGNPLPLTYTQVPVSDLKAASPDDPKLRRSKRARTKPLQYWKGEKYEYGANNFDEEIYDGVQNMPVVVKICKANPTPYKKRKAPSALSKKKAANKKSKKGDDAAASREPEETFDSSKLRTKYEVNDGKVAQLWDERYNDTRGIKVVSYHDTMEARDLPLSKSRKKSEGKVVGKAAQSFHMANDENPAFPGYIVGSLLLPPKGIKDAESVGLCAQVFTIVRGQPQSIEVAFGDPENDTPVWQADTAERFLLSQGDNFLVPPGNTYRIQNHSKTTEALMSWTIVRHNRGLAETETP